MTQRITKPYIPDPLTAYKIDSQEITLADSSRKKDLTIKVSFPQKPKTGFQQGREFPIIIISPLALGGKDCYEWLTTELVKSSNIVITVSHKDNVKVQRKTKGFGFLLSEGPRQAILNVMEDPEFWLDRICDIILIIKNLPKIEQAITTIRGHVKKTGVGIFGHSMGALTAMLAAGAKIHLPDRNLINLTNSAYKPTVETIDGKNLYSWKIPEISAAVIVSPIGPDAHFGLTENSYTFNIPCFFITANRDHSFGKENLNNSWKRQAFDLAETNEIKKYMLLFFETDHGFGDIAGCKVVSTFAGWTASAPIRNVIYMCSLAFFDYYLKNSNVASNWLDKDINSSFESLGYTEIKYADPNAVKAIPAPVATPPGYPTTSVFPPQHQTQSGYPQTYGSAYPGYQSQPGQPGYPPQGYGYPAPGYQSGHPAYAPQSPSGQPAYQSGTGQPSYPQPGQFSLQQGGYPPQSPSQPGYPPQSPGQPGYSSQAQPSYHYGSGVIATPGYAVQVDPSQAIYSSQNLPPSYPAPYIQQTGHSGQDTASAYASIHYQQSPGQPVPQAIPGGYPSGYQSGVPSSPVQSQPAGYSSYSNYPPGNASTGYPAQQPLSQSANSLGNSQDNNNQPIPPAPAVPQPLATGQVKNQSQPQQPQSPGQPAVAFDLLYPAREEKKQRYKLDNSQLAPPPTIEKPQEN